MSIGTLHESKGLKVHSWRLRDWKMKKIAPIFEGDIVDKKLKIQARVKREIARWCSTFKNGTHVEIIIRKFKTQRTNPQSNYYFGVVVTILADHFGYDKEDMHDELKLMFNPIRSKINPNRTIGGTTTKMDTVEFFSDENSYVERIKRWAATDHGIFIPDPKRVDS